MKSAANFIISCVHCLSIELHHAVGVFKHKFLRNDFQLCDEKQSCGFYLDSESSMWRFAAPQEKEISSKTTLQSFTWVEMDILGTKGVAVCVCKSVEYPQCFNDSELVKLFKTIGYINGQVGKLHPNLPGT